MSQGETLSVNDLVDREVAELNKMQKDLTETHMQQKKLCKQLKQVQEMLAACDKKVETMEINFSRKIQVVNALKDNPGYIKPPPESPYKKARSTRGSSFDDFDQSRDLDMEMASATKLVEESLVANAVAAENGAEGKATEQKVSADDARNKDLTDPVDAGNEN